MPGPPAIQAVVTRCGRYRRAFEAGLFYVGLALFGAMSLLWSVPAGVLHAMLPRRLGEPLGQRGIMAGFRAYLGIMQGLGQLHLDLRALDVLREAGPMVIIANHPALIDAVLIISRLPRVVCIAKAGLWNNWFLGGGIQLAGYIRNDAPHTSARQAIAVLRSGRQLLIFPEGTRTTPGRTLGPFLGGFVLIARRASVPIQTVFLEGGSPYLRKGWPLLRRPEPPLVLRARLGQRFEVKGTTRAFQAMLHGYMLQELTDPLNPG